MEKPPSPKNLGRGLENPEMDRRELVNLFAKLRQEKGAKHPDEHEFNDDPKVIKANDKFFAWVKQEDAKADKAGTQKAHFENLLSKDLFYVDAGFDDPDYLDEVASEFLSQDLDDAESVTDEDLSEIIAKFRNKIDELKSKIGSKN